MYCLRHPASTEGRRKGQKVTLKFAFVNLMFYFVQGEIVYSLVILETGKG